MLLPLLPLLPLVAGAETVFVLVLGR